MRKILRIARREYKTSVKTKGFIITLVLAPLLMGGSGLAMYLLRGQVDTTDKKVAVIDHSGAIADAIIKTAEIRNTQVVYDKETSKKVRPAYVFERVELNEKDPLSQRLELSNRIRSGELHAFLEIGPDVVHPEKEGAASQIAYHAKSAAIDELRSWLNNSINNHLRIARLAEAGVEKSNADNILRWINVEGLGLVSVDTETGEIKKAKRSSEVNEILAPIILFFMMFMMVMMGAMPLLQSVMEEKTQRIAEVVLGSVKPVEFMTGKILGGVSVSLTAASVYVITGIIALKLTGLEELIPYKILPWFFTFMVLNIIMMGSIFAALGSTCNDPKDAQNISFPAMIPIIIPMFLLMPVLQEPTSSFATWTSLFPPFTPMLMLLRLSSPTGIPMWQPWIGLIGILGLTLLSVWAAGRIFRVGILMQGKPPKLSLLLRWAIRG